MQQMIGFILSNDYFYHQLPKYYLHRNK